MELVIDNSNRSRRWATREVPHTENNFAQRLLDFSRSVMDGHFGGEAVLLEHLASVDQRIQEGPVERLNITLRCDGRIRGSMSAKGASLSEQVANAVYKALVDVRFGGPITASEARRTTIEVWLQTSSHPIDLDQRALGDCITLGHEGVEIRLDGKQAYFKPSVAITKSFSSPQRMFGSVCRKAGLPRDAWRDPNAVLLKTHWNCYIEDREQQTYTELRGLRRAAEVVSPPLLAEWIAASCAYLRNNQTAEGDIAYLYNPVNNAVDPEPINLVRAGGCLYSLSSAIDSGRLTDRRVAEQAAVALARFLLRKTIMWRDDFRVIGSARSSSAPKLGATALAAAALSLPYLKAQFPKESQVLITSVSAAQMATGKFITSFSVDDAENVRQANFFSGQALLALALNSQQSAFKTQYERAFPIYREHFRQGRTTAFTGWHVDLWSRLAIRDRRRDFADFAFEQTDWLLEKQVNSAAQPYWLGGFSKRGKPPAFSSIVFLEAVIRALILADHFGEAERAAKYRAAALLGLAFCAQLRLEVVPSAFFPDPVRTVGGVGLGLADLTVRCDVVQHHITLCLAALEASHLLFD
jgi:AMMECR1 domain-containing protein